MTGVQTCALPIWARLEDGDHAYTHIRNLLSTATESLLNADRYFQIDGNFVWDFLRSAGLRLHGGYTCIHVAAQ